MHLGRAISATCLVVVLMSASCATSSTGQSSDRDQGPHFPPLASSCERFDLEAARSKAPFELAMPSATTASEGTLHAVWFCPGNAYVLDFESGVTVWYAWNDIEDPVAEWQGLAREYREFSVGDVNGIPASLADPAVDGATGGVDWVVDGVRYTVSGNGEIPLEDLLDVARSMPIPPPS
jgi:hypothetical protein